MILSPHLQSYSLIQHGMPVLSSLNVSTSGLTLGISQRVRVDLQCLAGEIRQAAIKAAATLVVPTATTATTITNNNTTTINQHQHQQHEIVLKMTHGDGNVAVSLAFATHAGNARQLIVLARALGTSPYVHTTSTHPEYTPFQCIDSP